MEQVDRWYSSPAAMDHSCLIELADQLAARVDQWTTTGRGYASQLAARLLELPSRDDTAIRQRLVTSCAYVLAAGDATEPAPPEGLAANSLSGLLRNDAAEASLLPGGGLPIEVSSSPPLTRPARSDTMESAAADVRPAPEPRLLNSAVSPKYETMPAPLLTSSGSTANRSITAADPIARRLPLLPQAGHVLSLAEARALRENEADANPSGHWGKMATFDLVQRLHAEDVDVAAGARAELKRRGFREADFELANQLVEADAAARLEIAQKLPSMPGIDAAPWLLWLSRDENAEVRLTALGLLATTGTPELLTQAERIARDDSDPRIQQQAEQLAQRRRELR